MIPDRSRDLLGGRRGRDERGDRGARLQHGPADLDQVQCLRRRDRPLPFQAQDLAVRRHAGGRQPARDQPDVAAEVVRRAQVDQSSLDRSLAEEHRRAPAAAPSRNAPSVRPSRRVARTGRPRRSRRPAPRGPRARAAPSRAPAHDPASRAGPRARRRARPRPRRRRSPRGRPVRRRRRGARARAGAGR